jgi:hypothetical protein
MCPEFGGKTNAPTAHGLGSRTMRTKLVNEFGEAASSRSAPFRALVRRHIQIPSAALV